MKTVVLISAKAEWQPVKTLFPGVKIQLSPFGEWFTAFVESMEVIFFHGGWGKIAAAASTQFVIDHFFPQLLVNLGTCGGFESSIESGVVILVEKTVVYDIIEQMGDPKAAIGDYSTTIDLSWLPMTLPSFVKPALMVSGDRDILTSDIPQLISQYGAVAADWESGAIAWVAIKNRTRVLILRGVSDLVGADGGEAYGNLELFEQRTGQIMQRLVFELGGWIKAAAQSS